MNDTQTGPNARWNDPEMRTHGPFVMNAALWFVVVSRLVILVLGLLAARFLDL